MGIKEIIIIALQSAFATVVITGIIVVLVAISDKLDEWHDR
jgi:hypothetical protein